MRRIGTQKIRREENILEQTGLKLSDALTLVVTEAENKESWRRLVDKPSTATETEGLMLLMMTRHKSYTSYLALNLLNTRAITRKTTTTKKLWRKLPQLDTEQKD